MQSGILGGKLFVAKMPSFHFEYLKTTMPNSKNSYNLILTQISKILEETRRDFKEGSNQFVLTSNWEIGNRNTEIEQDGKAKPKYGERIITRLSTDLNKRFGGGYSEKNMQKVLEKGNFLNNELLESGLVRVD